MVAPVYADDLNKDFIVTKPSLQGSTITYLCKGVDAVGPWEGNRRYN